MAESQDRYQPRKRPQYLIGTVVPTKKNLALKLGEAERKHAEERSIPSTVVIRHRKSMTLPCLGKIDQPDRDYSLYFKEPDTIIATKKQTYGSPERDILERLGHHPNITTLHEILLDEDTIYLCLESAEFTLHDSFDFIRWDEKYIRLITQSIFGAIQHVSDCGYLHTQVGRFSIRISFMEGKVLLADFERAMIWDQRKENIDLEGLGLTILECMDGPGKVKSRTATTVQSEREENRMFGLNDPTPWMGHENLVDFLDFLFDNKKPALSKISNSHPYINLRQNAKVSLKQFLLATSLKTDKGFEAPQILDP